MLLIGFAGIGFAGNVRSLRIWCPWRGDRLGNAPLADATNSRDVRSTSLPLEYAWSIRHVVAGHRTGATKVFGPRFDRDRRSADRSYRVRRLPIDDGPEF